MKTSSTNQTEEMVTLYHAFSTTSHFQSFLNEGAKPIGHGGGGQSGGFFVWNNKEAAINHLRHIYLGKTYYEPLDAMIVGVSIPKKDIVYPTWQPDMNELPTVLRLCAEYGDFINEKAKNLHIPFDDNSQPEEWDFQEITRISCDESEGHSYSLFSKNLIFHGIDTRGYPKSLSCTDPWKGTSQRLQIISDWLYQNNPEFRTKINTLMQEKLTSTEGFALKYTGPKEASLPISYAEYVKTNNEYVKVGSSGQKKVVDRPITQTVVFDAQQAPIPEKGCPRDHTKTCPILTKTIPLWRLELAKKSR